jgi:methionyl-tRNA formyltransferase
MKLIFAGTPAFAAQALDALIAAGHQVELVLTQPDRPSGRGMKLKPGAVKQCALTHGLRVEQPLTLKTAEAQQMIADVGAELMIVAAYGLILPQAVLDLPARGCLNIHASLLPRWRGAAPIQRALQAGDSHSGVTIMQMDAGLDTGAMLSVYPLELDASETGASLHDRLAQTGALAIVETLAKLDQLQPQPQPELGISYAHKLSKQESAIDWSLPAEVIARTIRAFNPVPGSSTHVGDASIKLWMAEAQPGQAEAGRVLSADATGVLVGCGQGLVLITELQAAGGKRLPAREFVAGHPGLVGTLLS